MSCTCDLCHTSRLAIGWFEMLYPPPQTREEVRELAQKLIDEVRKINERLDEVIRRCEAMQKLSHGHHGECPSPYDSAGNPRARAGSAK